MVSILLFGGSTCYGSGKEIAQLPSLSIIQRGAVTHFGKSRRYTKRGIRIVVLRGEPYEMGYARGVLLREEIRDWVRDFQHRLKQKSLETGFDKTQLFQRAREIQAHIPAEYAREIEGLSAGSGIDKELLLTINVLGTIAVDTACTSVVIKSAGGSLLRSRNLDLHDQPALPGALYFYEPSQGHPFVSLSHLPAFIGTKTAFNQKGLSIGAHDVSRKSRAYVKGEPHFILRRRVAQYAGSVAEAGRILKKAQRSVTLMWLVADSQTAGVYEFNPQETAFYEMGSAPLVLTNHARLLNIGGISKSSLDRQQEARAFLARHQGKMTLSELIDLNRGNQICFANHPGTQNLHGAIFKADTLDFWIAIEIPPATRGKWVGFNFNKELHGTGIDPEPRVIPPFE